jgi:anti-sigma factor RsiW
MRPLGALRFHLDHRFTQRHVSEFLDGELPEDGRGRVARHAALCPQCAHLIASLRATIAALRGLPAEPDGSVAERVIGSLRREA